MKNNTITREELAKKEQRYYCLGEKNIIADAVMYLASESRFRGVDDLTDLIMECVKGYNDRSIYKSVESAADYFEKFKGEINLQLANDGDAINPMDINGFDSSDPLVLTCHNKMVLAQWAFEAAVAEIAMWFDLEW